jgi:hypothetical protein
MMRRHWQDFVFVVLAACVLGFVAWDAFGPRIITNNRGSDYWEHTAVLHALLEDPWHPRHPLIAGDLPSPRFNPHFLLIALVARACSIDALGAISIAAVLNTALFLLGIFLFFRRYLRDARASLYGLIVMLGSWWEGPHFSNVYQLRVLFSSAGYPSAAALALTLLGFTLTLEILRSERERRALLVFSAFAWAYVYITHPLTATMALTGTLLLCLTEPGVVRRRRALAAGAALFGLLLAGVWPYYPALGMVFHGTLDRLQHGHPAGTPAVHPFYGMGTLLGILGFCLLSVPLIPYFLLKRKQLFVPLGALAMATVFVASRFLPIPLGHRFILLTVFFLQVGLVWLLLELTPREAAGWAARRPLRLAAAAGVGALLLFCTVRNVREAIERFAGARTRGESSTVRLGRRVGKIAGEDAVVLASALDSWPLPTFGPKVIALHHRNPLIRDSAERDRAVARFFSRSGSDQERERILEQFGVTHVLFTGRGGAAEEFISSRGTSHNVPGGRLYTVAR